MASRIVTGSQQRAVVGKHTSVASLLLRSSRTARPLAAAAGRHPLLLSPASVPSASCRTIVASAGGLASPSEEGSREGSDQLFDSAMRLPTTAMAKGLGSFGGATMERSKLDMSQKVQEVSPKLDDGSGGGGIGGKIFNGGGGDGDERR